MIETDAASARMTVTSAMLDDDGIVITGYLLVLADSARRSVPPFRTADPFRCVIDVLGPLPGAGAVLLAESTTATTDDQLVVDTVIRQENADLSVLAAVRTLVLRP